MLVTWEIWGNMIHRMEAIHLEAIIRTLIMSSVHPCTVHKLLAHMHGIRRKFSWGEQAPKKVPHKDNKCLPHGGKGASRRQARVQEFVRGGGGQ